MKQKKSKRLSVWKSKKAGIPAINEIVMTILNVTPKPILLLIFLLLITTIATFVIPVFLNLFGYDCVETNSQLKLYQIPMNKIASKSIQDLREGVRGIAGFEDYELPDDPFPDGNKEFLRVPADCFIEADINGSTVTGYSSACVNCTKSGLFRYSGSICLDDGFYDPTLVTRYWIGTANYCFKCAPPNPYYYNHSYCHSQDQCFFTITDPALVSQVGDDYADLEFENRLISLGGVVRPQDSSQIANIQCVDHRKPQLYFFSIELFNRTMWIFLICSYFLISFAMMWYSMTGIS